MKRFKIISFIFLAVALVLAITILVVKITGNSSKASETGYYVVWDDFTMISANDYSECHVSAA